MQITDIDHIYMSETKAKSYVGQHVQARKTGFKSVIQSHEGRYTAYGNVWWVYSEDCQKGTYMTESEVMFMEHILGDMAIAIYGG